MERFPLQLGVVFVLCKSYERATRHTNRLTNKLGFLAQIIFRTPLRGTFNDF